MLGRLRRAENRDRLKSNSKKVLNASVTARKWEKKWVTIPDTSLQVLKWVPVASSKPALRGLKMEVVTHTRKKSRSLKENMTEEVSATIQALNTEKNQQRQNTCSSFSGEMQNEDSNLSSIGPLGSRSTSISDGSPEDLGVSNGIMDSIALNAEKNQQRRNTCSSFSEEMQNEDSNLSSIGPLGSWSTSISDGSPEDLGVSNGVMDSMACDLGPETSEMALMGESEQTLQWAM